MDADDHRDLDEFIQETRASQRNIVFPDTVRNGRSVDAFLWHGSPDPPLVQRIGAWIFGSTFIGLGLSSFIMAAAFIRDGSWSGFGVFILIGFLVLLFGIRTFRNGFPKPKKRSSSN